MSLPRVASVSIGVPTVAETAASYEEFGLTRLDDSRFATADGGEQLRLVHSPRRRLVELGIGVADPDDLESAASRLTALGVIFRQTPDAVAAVDAGPGVRVVLRVPDPIAQTAARAAALNAAGRAGRRGARAEAVLRDSPVRPRQLRHVVLGSPHLAPQEP